jgi:hypothetical protein
MDGIAHCQIFLADVSSAGYDSKTGNVYRNSNVMYEVGLAVACRQPTEVLLIRDDQHPFLFDVSTIPHKNIDFSDVKKARKELRQELRARLRERDLFQDARVQLAVATLSSEEMTMLAQFLRFQPYEEFGFPQPAPYQDGRPHPVTVDDILLISAMPRLLDKEIIKVTGRNQYGEPVYQWTQLGYVVAQGAQRYLRQIQIGPNRRLQPF